VDPDPNSYPGPAFVDPDSDFVLLIKGQENEKENVPFS
jgi:hypothetical protein